eukprot:NODE_3980_length_1250_cov_26.866016_g3492_i0.p1 GENE.NODE_3980_length_1250_cov_26.866016_g3492_i0~~NODE_3980_length_1250_cov_26.866016_g3492_i0.p1  ORF type:complete len:271 (-),score=40.69 NODE_3980_length_1250_cov_26.866016_g3492_i0:436-1167(-)
MAANSPRSPMSNYEFTMSPTSRIIQKSNSTDFRISLKQDSDCNLVSAMNYAKILNLQALNQRTNRRIITSMVIDVVGFESWLFKKEDEITFQHRQTITFICKIITSYGGTIDRFFGDKILVSWNTLRNNYEHAVDSCKCALALNKSLSFRIGISTHFAVYGIMGCDGMKSFSVVGPSVSIAFQIIHYSRHHNIIGSFVNQSNWEKCRYELKTKWIGNLVNKNESKIDSKSQSSVYQLLDLDIN